MIGGSALPALPRMRVAGRILRTGVAGLLGLGAMTAAWALDDCRVPGIAHGVQCGSLVRALDPARPNGPQIDVHYVVVPALARRKLSDPVFLLAGGPGQSAIELAPQLMRLFARLNNRRDIVFVDQRGTGRSAPLVCADNRREPLAEQADLQRQVEALARCRADLQRLPYVREASDLAYFSTVLAMQDLDAVRRQLGAQQLNLVGVSYGTRAALEYMRQFPGAVRRSVLDAVAPPDMALPASFSIDNQAALDSLLAACQAEAACAAAYPNLRKDWARLLASLPRPATVAHPLSGLPEHFMLTRAIVLGSVRAALYAPAVASALPQAITEAAAGQFEALAGIGSMLGSRKGLQLATGMHFSVVCAEDVPRMAAAGEARGPDFGDDFATLYRRVCADWPRRPLPPEFYRIAPTHVPTLLLSGGLDPATPPRHGARVAQALGPTARHVVVANAAHGTLGLGCTSDLVYRFVNAVEDHDAAAVDASCLQSVPRPGAFRPIRPDEGRAP